MNPFNRLLTTALGALTGRSLLKAIVSAGRFYSEVMLAAILLVMTPRPSTPQPAMVWSQTFGGEGNEDCAAMIRTRDGGFALAGYTTSFGAGGQDFWLVKTDADGRLLWSRTYGGPHDEGCRALVETPDGGLALAGWTDSFTNGWADFWLVRTSEDGDSLWSHIYGNRVDDVCYSVIVTRDGGFALAGYTALERESLNYFVVRTNSEGDSLWAGAYGGSDIDACFDIVELSEGRFLLAGVAVIEGPGPNYWLVWVDDGGDSLASRYYSNFRNNRCYSLLPTQNGGYFLTGYTNRLREGSSDAWVVEVDSEGDSLTSWIYGSPRNDDYARVTHYTLDGGRVLAGTSKSYRNGEEDYWLVKTDTDGDTLWLAVFGGDQPEVCVEAIETDSGDFVLGGTAQSGPFDDINFWLIKVSENPNQAVVHDHTASITPTQISSIYPNPSNGRILLSFNNYFTGNIQLYLCDCDGRVIRNISNRLFPSESNLLEINLLNLPTGSYFVTCVNNGLLIQTGLIRLIR